MKTSLKYFNIIEKQSFLAWKIFLFHEIKNNVEKEWIVIGQVDVETLVKTHLSSKQDWEKNFKALKVRGKEAERLPRYSVTILLFE